MNVWSEKLPFAGYSVVKDHSGLGPEPRLGRSRGPFAPLRSLAARLRSLRRDYHGGVAQPESRVKDRRTREPTALTVLSTVNSKLGGEYRARTGDLLVANQALSQLS
jgi:hypothetical protein